MIEQALVAFLLADSGVSLLVGTRIYGSGQAPQAKDVSSPDDPGALPLIVMWRRTTPRRPLSQNGAKNPTKAITQIDCWAATAAGAKALALAVLNATDGADGELHGWSQALMANLVFVQQCKIDGDTDAVEGPLLGQGAGRCCVHLDATTWFNER